jgi:pimeloyl-ACP methyl ester carboxylesterase
MAIVLSGSAQPVSLGQGYALRSPGLKGSAEILQPGSTTSRSASRSLDAGLLAFDSALRSEHMTEVKVIDLTLIPADPAAPAALRSVQGENQVELEVPDLGQQTGQIVVSVDDLGAIRWHLPIEISPITAGVNVIARGAGTTRRFRIPARLIAPSAAAGGTVQQRSIFGAVARRLLKVIVYPLTDPLIGAISEHFAKRWEEEKRPYRLRRFTPVDYASSNATLLSNAELEQMRVDGPMLAFIHGTFSTSHGGFGGLPAATLEELHRRYGGRVFAFDHPTLGDSPIENVQWLLAQLPPGPMQLDIVCHSRGGLVSRLLAEQPPGLGMDDAARLDVRRVVLGGVPNAGTALADPDHMVHMIDRLCTALTLAPTGPVTETIEALVPVVKMLGHGALKGLPGLASMHPTGDFLATLNRPGHRHSQYFAIASDYEPTDRGLRALVSGALDNVVDQVFGEAGNDLVVPTDGVWRANGGSGFPVEDERLLRYAPEQGVMHTDFFPHLEVSEKLLTWLSVQGNPNT